MKTMTTTQQAALAILRGTGISLLDAARLIRQILDFKPPHCKYKAVVFCTNVIQSGLAQQHIKQQKVKDGFAVYLTSKQHLRPDSLRDIRYLGKRLQNTRPDLGERDFNSLSLTDCEQWLNDTFTTPSQFNKGRTFLHGLFHFACCREWCHRNPIRYLAKKRVIEKEIKPLSLEETQNIITQSQLQHDVTCAPAAALLLWAGLRPTELKRLRWRDIDLAEKSITIRRQCSKTGGTRHVDICSPLFACLKQHIKHATTLQQSICPPNWRKKWQQIRHQAGFATLWVQDVLRHTYASYHAKRFKNMPLLQLNMGHRDQSLLRARYVNIQGISRKEAELFFSTNSNYPASLETAWT